MKCPKEKRECPNGWTDCNLCAYWDIQHKKCAYVPEEEPEPDNEPEESELTEDELTVDLGIEIPSIRGTEQFLDLTPDEAMMRFYSKHPPNLHHKEPMPAGNGIPGGGSKSKVKKSNKGTKVFVDPWEGI